ncbi:hypothetical protein [Frigidibacter sp. ROC022]|uniref:hypothetical protein n=1 Tax=Frigidibacter sp. ROC022 TaxID=2971796 RepID=UPI00215B210A|nr:hypothetical protein [Frigidibacter sp. ROC022]MCR8724173.1 hypothetical protein [Frigidibacter sp. ROC022]
MAFVRLFLIMAVVLGVIYWLVSIYSRSVRTERLEKRWDRDRPPGIDRETYVREGLEKYDNSFRRKLIVLILILPFIAVFGAIYVTNYMPGYR